MPPRTGPLDKGALKRITDDIAALDKRVDTVVVLRSLGNPVHPSTRGQPAPGRRGVRRCRRGSGDRWPPALGPGLQQFGSTPVVYSLGNYVFDMDFQVKTNEGVVLEAVLWDGKVKAVEFVPYVIGGDFVPRQVGGSRGRGILDDLWGSSRGPWAEP